MLSSRTKEGHAAIFKNRKPAMVSAIDIEETGRNVIMKIKVLKLWDTRSDRITQAGLVGDETGNISSKIRFSFLEINHKSPKLILQKNIYDKITLYI